MDQDTTWHDGRLRPGQHCVRCGPSSAPSGCSHQLSAHVCCGQRAGWIKMPHGREVGLGPGDIVLDGDSATQKRIQPPFSAYVCCGQTAGWIKVPGHILLHGEPAPPKVAQPPISGPCLLWPQGRPSQLLLSTCMILYAMHNTNIH